MSAQTQAIPIDIDSFKNQRLVVQLENDQQKHQEKGHKNAHDWCGAPAWDNLAVFRIQGAEQISQTGALSHDSAEVSGGIKSRYCRGSDP